MRGTELLRPLAGLLVIGLAAGGLAGCDFDGRSGLDGLGCKPKRNIAADNASHVVYRDGLVPETTSALTFP